MITLIVDNKVVETNRIQFSDGAVSFDLKDLPDTFDKVVFSVDPSYKVNGLLDELSQLLPTIWSKGNLDFHTEIYLPYLPYAIADRKFSDTGNNGLKYFLNEIHCNMLNKITTVDPHNISAVVEYCTQVGVELNYTTQLEAFKQVVSREHLSPKSEWDYIIAPDKGAKDKAQSIADYYGIPLVLCTKERNVTTGKLSNPVVNGEVSGKRVLIVDDLGDAMGTFIQLANELQKQVPAKIDLYVTHLIGCKGLDILQGKIDNVYCYQTVAGYLTMQDVHKFNKGITC
jgi:ribose-phosphate pyrophosphokinase